MYVSNRNYTSKYLSYEPRTATASTLLKLMTKKTISVMLTLSSEVVLLNSSSRSRFASASAYSNSSLAQAASDSISRIRFSSGSDLKELLTRNSSILKLIHMLADKNKKTSTKKVSCCTQRTNTEDYLRSQQRPKVISQQ